jgi:hypothetical protein
MMSSPAPLGMFIIGFIIFALYLWGLLTMIYRGHRQQREELENDPEIQAYYKSLEEEDWEYPGYNPHSQERKYYIPKKKRKKYHVGKKMNYD